jgi:hypothetical protein
MLQPAGRALMSFASGSVHLYLCDDLEETRGA